MNKPHIHVILSSIREGRAGQNVANWAMSALKERQDANFELVDLKDYPLPMFDTASFPSMVNEGNYGNEAVNKFAQKINQADGFIFITPEYNHGYSSALKNAIDHIYKEWNNKSAGFVSYGSIAGGSRATEQLRQVVGELQIADVRTSVHIPNIWAAFDDQGNLINPEVGAPLDMMTDQVVAWAQALKTVRQPAEVAQAAEAVAA